MSRTSFRVNLHSITWLNVKELLARSRCHIWSLSDSNEIQSHNHLICKQTLNHLAKLVYWLWVQIQLLSLQFFILQFDNSFLKRCNILFCFSDFFYFCYFFSSAFWHDTQTHHPSFWQPSLSAFLKSLKLKTHCAMRARHVHLKKCFFLLIFSRYLDCMLFQVAHNHVVYYQSFGYYGFKIHVSF